uniref:Uncharacterized protein n=1 Tax=Tanacetum cinerariifolium TaxID=118510 RepID=A0A6L2MWF2_TANCI|nr:hypothetical protein [Tanacetum cinerariifolium]
MKRSFVQHSQRQCRDLRYDIYFYRQHGCFCSMSAAGWPYNVRWHHRYVGTPGLLVDGVGAHNMAPLGNRIQNNLVDNNLPPHAGSSVHHCTQIHVP